MTSAEQISRAVFGGDFLKSDFTDSTLFGKSFPLRLAFESLSSGKNISLFAYK